MLILKTDVLELRGIKNETSKNGNVYQVLNCEAYDGEPHAFYCPDSSLLPSGMKKGDKIVLHLSVKTFKGNRSFSICKVEHLK